MTIKRTPRPRDPIQLGKLMVDIAAGAVPDGVDDGKGQDEAEMKQSRARKGGATRADKLSPDKRKAIANRAANKRWGNSP